MKALKKDLQSIVKSLKALTQKTEKIAKQLDKLKKATVAKKPRAKVRVKAKPVKKAAVKKTKKMSASDTVLAIIKRSKKGIDTSTLKKKTGFKSDNLRMIIYRLKKQGKIKSGGRGVYLKA